MKRQLVVIGLLAMILLLAVGPGWAQEDGPRGTQGTSFTYQGLLTDAGGPVNARCDFGFTLWDRDGTGGTQIGPSEGREGVSVSDGRFTVPDLDFGRSPFQGEARWLEIAVRCPTGTGKYTTLSRQALTATPYAIYALDAAKLDGHQASSFWMLAGNASTTPGTHFLGTTDGQALELKVNDARALRLEPGSTPNLIGGYFGNSVIGGVVGATVGGGGSSGHNNLVTDNYGTVGGGYGNQAGDNASATNDRSFATVAGGQDNTASGVRSTIGGGYDNTASGEQATVSGGASNSATAYRSTVGGGWSHEASAEYATIGGGYNNAASGNKSTVAGGESNSATALRATVGGGYANEAVSQDTTIGGGYDNTATGLYSTVSGGYSNETGTEQAATIGGGYNNTAQGEYATIGGGYSNTAGGDEAAVGGGSDNQAGHFRSTVAGGWSNSADGEYASVLGGADNTAGQVYATVGGGHGHLAQGWAATIGGGWDNRTDGEYATVPGGQEASAPNYGQMAYASGQFDTKGDAQASMYVMRNTSSGSGWTNLYLDGMDSVLYLNGGTLAFEILVVGRSSAGESAGYQIRGVIEDASTDTVIGSSVMNLGEDDSAWDAQVVASNGALVVQVHGNGESIRWVATVRTAEVRW